MLIESAETWMKLQQFVLEQLWKHRIVVFTGELAPASPDKAFERVLRR